MKSASKHGGLVKRAVIGATVLLLCACSALQIDVDVYKGPMTNHEDIQLQQYTALAISARPIIVGLRNRYIKEESYLSYGDGDGDKGKYLKEYDLACLKEHGKDMDQYVGCPFQLNNAHFLNTLLALYEDIDAVEKKDKEQPSKKLQALKNKIIELGIPIRELKNEDKRDVMEVRDTKGITTLANNFYAALAEVINKDTKENNDKVRKKREHLSESLMLFAEKVLFTVNNYDLAFGNRTNGDNAFKKSFAQDFAVLQSLGNTLNVLADDQRKRATHGLRLVERKDSELAAAQQAFSPGAQNAFDNLLNNLGAAIKQKKEEQESLQDAIKIFNEKPLSEDEITEQKKALEKDADKNQLRLDTYRTVFGNYDYGLKINDIKPIDSAADQDRNSIASLFEQTGEKQADKKESVDDVLKTLRDWFTADKTTPQGDLSPPSQDVERRYARRNNANNYLKKLTAASFNIEAGKKKDVFDKLGQALLVALNENKSKLEGLQKKINDDRKALGTFKNNNVELPKVQSAQADLESAFEKINSIKQAVLQQAETAKVVDLSGLRHLLLLELKKKNDDGATTAADKVKLQAASKMLTEMAIPKSFQLVGGSGVKTQRDVLDDVIAQLQQQRLQAAAEGHEIASLTKALELAYEQRGGLAYLRPASAYLRNAFSNTSMQDGNTSRDNLLVSCTFILWCEGENEYNKEFRKTKLEIDKQYWQTINTVKVRGGGTTDFAIVKDDVGNWYIKGLSSDPESIIKSAQGLMLFNSGAKFNVNLLAQMEDQRALARKDSTLSETERAKLRDNLNNSKAGSGVNTSALSKLHTRYLDEYVLTTRADVDSLDKALTELPASIQAAWDKIAFDDAAKVASIEALNSDLGKRRIKKGERCYCSSGSPPSYTPSGNPSCARR